MPMKMLRLYPAVLLSAALLLHAANKPKPAAPAPVATDPYAEVQPATEPLDLNMYQRIRDEGSEPLARNGVCHRADGRHWPAADRLAQPEEG